MLKELTLEYGRMPLTYYTDSSKNVRNGNFNRSNFRGIANYNMTVKMVELVCVKAFIGYPHISSMRVLPMGILLLSWLKLYEILTIHILSDVLIG